MSLKLLPDSINGGPPRVLLFDDPEVQTGSSLALTYTSGYRHFISHQPNNYTLSFSDIDLAMLAGGGHLLRADVWFSQTMGVEGAGYYCGGELIVEPGAPVREQMNATGSGDLLSTCMMLLHERTDIPVSEKLRLANRIVAEYIEGKREFLPPM